MDIDEFIELMRIKSKEAADEAEIKEAFRILDRDSKGKARESRQNQTQTIEKKTVNKRQTSRTEFVQQMRSGDLPAYFSLNCLLNGILSYP